MAILTQCSNAVSAILKHKNSNIDNNNLTMVITTLFNVDTIFGIRTNFNMANT